MIIDIILYVLIGCWVSFGMWDIWSSIGVQPQPWIIVCGGIFWPISLGIGCVYFVVSCIKWIINMYKMFTQDPELAQKMIEWIVNK